MISIAYSCAKVRMSITYSGTDASQDGDSSLTNGKQLGLQDGETETSDDDLTKSSSSSTGEASHDLEEEQEPESRVEETLDDLRLFEDLV